MILFDAIYINDSGGKVLLDYLISEIEKRNLNVYYLLDSRVKNKIQKIDNNKLVFIKSTYLNRFRFYLKNKERFEKVFCFGNISPPIKMNVEVYTYFHNILLLSSPNSLPFFFKLKFFLKSKIFKKLAKNTDYWIVQTNLIKNELLNFFSNDKAYKVSVIPFYPNLEYHGNDSIKRRQNVYLYVSNFTPQKNHNKLIDAFTRYFDDNNIGELHITINKNDDNYLLEKVTGLISNGYPIVNHGFVKQEKLVKLYRESEYIIYPSLAESFGLGIIEGIENGCKVVGSDLPFLKEICETPFLFDPNSVESIKEAFEKAQNSKELLAKQLVYNQINEIINIIK
mgnify:CR=1 FL=1